MSKHQSDWESDLVVGLLALGLLVLAVLAFWWLKGAATIWRAFAARPSNLALWLAALACLVTTAAVLVTNGNVIALVCGGVSWFALYLVAVLVSQGSQGETPTSLDDVISSRW